jgi:D-glycero-alpha-D-manno-heptose-7-phosphate kinase
VNSVLEIVAHGSAPLRLDLAGGWTDVPPFSAREGGLVVSIALGLYAHATVETGGQGLVLISEDLLEEVRLGSPTELDPKGPLPLLQSALLRFPVSPCMVTTRSEAPAGSGLGSSGALDVALVSALLKARGETLEREELAHEAWEVEAIEAGMAGGKQDQYSAALGGCRVIRFNDPEVEAKGLALDDGLVDHLQRHLVLCYTGTSRVSGDTIRRVMGAYERGDAGVVRALRGLKEVASRMVDALKNGKSEEIGALLSANWEHQRALDPQMQTPEMLRLEHAMRQAGVHGGKAAGSGAGGCMFFLAGRDPVGAANAARQAGAQVLPVTLVKEGVRTW